LAGCNVTVPYKRAVMDLADLHDESAEEAGAANVLARDPTGRVVAHNTDAEALARDVDEIWHGRPRLSAAIIGAGGAGLAALVASKQLGFKVVCVTSRSWTNTETMFDADASQRARALGAFTVPWPRLDEAAPTGKASQALRIQWNELVARAD